MEKRKGTVWVIGASSGLGLATANAFVKDGWQVIAGARSFRGEEQTEKDGMIRLELDVTDGASRDAFARRALACAPGVDALVCCAAQLVLGSCENTSMSELANIMNTNFLGAVAMVQHVLPQMRAQKSGRIILFSSINGLLGIPFQSAYTASKHALEGYGECLAMETKPYGIQVCLVEPGDHRGGSNRTRLHAAMEMGDSAYHQAYQRACAVIHRDEAGGLSPEALGRKVVKNANRKRMRFRLRVAKLDQLSAIWMHTLLPMSVNQKILIKYYDD